MTEQNYNNAKVAYEYTKSIWEEVNASYDVLTTKLTTALGFSGLLLRFAADLSDTCWLIYVKVSVCILLFLAVVSCGIGLYPASRGKDAVDPDTYLNDKTGEIYGLSEEKSYLYLARGLSASTKSLIKNRRFRANCLMCTTYLVGFAALGFAISIIGKSLLIAAKQ